MKALADLPERCAASVGYWFHYSNRPRPPTTNTTPRYRWYCERHRNLLYFCLI